MGKRAYFCITDNPQVLEKISEAFENYEILEEIVWS